VRWRRFLLDVVPPPPDQVKASQGGPRQGQGCGRPMPREPGGVGSGSEPEQTGNNGLFVPAGVGGGTIRPPLHHPTPSEP